MKKKKGSFLKLTKQSRMTTQDISLGVALGSATQIATFVVRIQVAKNKYNEYLGFF